jgi:diazepam-binding inhibitor (GABA receptor modulator, acyl-CoA-binding protein)
MEQETQREMMTMSEELNEKFAKAKEESVQLSKAPDNMTKLEMYGIYKQAAEGDCTGKRPGMTDFVGRAKYDAWKKNEGMSQDEAKQKYIDLIEKLKAEDAG